MNASIVDLRYKTSQILAALDKRERVNILYHGKLKGVIFPAQKKMGKKTCEQEFFGMKKKEKQSVLKIMSSLRGGRYSAL